jgi:phosphoglycerate dehydrogenase-like enzyme
MTRVAILDDWQGVAQASADWSGLADRAQLVFFAEAFADETAAVQALADFDIILSMRERTPLPASLIDRLPKLRMLGITGASNKSLDVEACTRRGILVCNTVGTGGGGFATAELALGVLLAAARAIPAGDAMMRAGGFQKGLPVGISLEGKTLGIIGLGRLGARMACYGLALGMKVMAWSENLTEAKAKEVGVTYASKAALLEASDAISLHLVLSPRSTGIIGAAEIARMKPGAILINTSRGPLVDETALIAAVKARRIVAALDVFDREPLPQNHPLRQAPNTVLMPHLGYGVAETWADFYPQSVENALAFLDGKAIRVINPEAAQTS